MLFFSNNFLALTILAKWLLFRTGSKQRRIEKKVKQNQEYRVGMVGAIFLTKRFMVTIQIAPVNATVYVVF